MRVEVYKKENGFIVEAHNEGEILKEIVVEGKDPKKIGQAVLAAFAKPRGPHKKRDKAAA